MNTFQISPKILLFDTLKDYLASHPLKESDLLFVSDHSLKQFFQDTPIPSHIINLRKYGRGEPTDKMVEAIYEDTKQLTYNRVLAIGGGSILDVAKLFALKKLEPLEGLFGRHDPAIRDKGLVLIPTTCGTGSEVTNISILELTSLGTKKGLAAAALYADEAVIIPQLLEGLPYQYFATSSLDAFIHALESYLSPKATPFSEMYSLKAMELILKGYQYLAARGHEARGDYAKNFMMAGTLAGIAFDNAGCAAVHALSYPLGAFFHIPHGEANYTLLMAVLKAYEELAPHGKLLALSNHLSEILSCCAQDSFKELDLLLTEILPRKSLSSYGVNPDHIVTFSESVLANQERLLANNYVALTLTDIQEIYLAIY